MKWIGLTGGIGTGKSTVSQLLGSRGWTVISADELARYVVEPGRPGLERIQQVFGPGVIGSDGHLNRAELGKIIFSDASQRKTLESLLHPLIRQETLVRRAAAEAQGAAVAIYDVPLLFETDMQSQFDLTVLVSCTPAQQIERICRRDHLTQEEAELRIASQLSLKDKADRADYIISNTGSLLHLASEVKVFVDTILSEGHA